MASPMSSTYRVVEHATRAVLFVDVVESVRLIEQDEVDTLSRWLAFVDHVEAEMLPELGGHLVKRLGDGMLLEFPDSRTAMAVAFALRHAINRYNRGLPPDRQLMLRIGGQISDVIVDKDDVYGRGVNLATRLTSLAGPNEIVVSSQVRSELTPMLDADIEDLGECFLKHIKEPVRAYRVGPPGPQPVVAPALPPGELRPSLAIVPFISAHQAVEYDVLGEILAEEAIKTLSHSHDLNVISRLSTTAMRGRNLTLEQISGYLNSDYVLSGSYQAADKRFTLDVELAEAKSGQIIWTDTLSGRIDQVLSGEREVIGRIVTGVSTAIVSREVQRALSQPPPTLKSYTLLLGAIGMMHRLSRRDFDEAHHLLRTVIDRASRQSLPCAWMAKWHVLRVQQGWSIDPQEDGQVALQYTNRALDTDPDSSLALAIDGFVHTNLLRELDIAEERYDRAIAVNPNELLAWLLRGTLYAFRGEGVRAVQDTQRALVLSPLDPHRYFYDSLSASAFIAARRYEDALDYALRSYRANRTHTSTLRVLAVARWQLGQREEARQTAAELLKLQPSLTVRDWLARSPSGNYEVGKEFADILRQVGIPA